MGYLIYILIVIIFDNVDEEVVCEFYVPGVCLLHEGEDKFDSF